MEDHRIYCNYCGKKIAEGIHFCPYCGKEQPQALNNDEIKKNPFAILQISENAEQEVVDAAYRSLARKYHPDGGTSIVSEERMQEINWAHGILSNPEKLAEWKIKNGRGQTPKTSAQVQSHPINLSNPVTGRQSPPVSKSPPTITAKVQPPPINKPTPVTSQQSPPVSKSSPPIATYQSTTEPSNTDLSSLGMILVIVVVIVAVIVGIVSQSNNQASSPTSYQMNTPIPLVRLTNTYIPIETLIPTTIKPTRTPGSGDIIFYDDFSDTNSGWVTKNINLGTTGYTNGIYQILVTTPNAVISSKPSMLFPNNVRIEVDAQAVNTPRNSYFGLACRYKDKSHFYILLITNNGYAAIGKMDDEYLSLFHNFITISNIKENAYNHLRADCIGNELTLYVNGKFAVHEVENTYSEGSVALVAGNFSEVGIEAIFDNFYTYMP